MQSGVPRFRWIGHASPEELAGALAAHAASVLAGALAARGRALLAVSGGTTPVRFFRALASMPLDWPGITVTLVDERFVPPDSPRSNGRLVRENLLAGAAAEARFVPFADAEGPPSPERAAQAVSAALGSLPLPFDLVVLGMGTDGHTASFFPDAEGLDRLLDPRQRALVLPVRAASAGEPRLTLSLPAIAAARNLVLHIEGDAKKAAFEAAMDPATLPARPVRTVLGQAASQPLVFWSPSQGSQP